MNAAARLGCLVLHLLFCCGELNVPVSAEMSYRHFIIDSPLLSSIVVIMSYAIGSNGFGSV